MYPMDIVHSSLHEIENGVQTKRSDAYKYEQQTNSVHFSQIFSSVTSFYFQVSGFKAKEFEGLSNIVVLYRQVIYSDNIWCYSIELLFFFMTFVYLVRVSKVY